MALGDEFRAMTDEQLQRIIGSDNRPLHEQTIDQLLAHSELRSREWARGESVRRATAKARSDQIASRVKEGGFSTPTIEAVAQLLSSSSHVILWERAPMPFQYLPTWMNAEGSAYMLRYCDGAFENMISGLPGDMFDGMHCFTKAQVMSGLVRKNALVIRNGEAYEEHIEFVTQHLSYSVPKNFG